jgi:hypothetical protein
MPQTSPMLQLNPSMWFGWEMIPGYLGERNVPYHSPIYVRRVTPNKTGKKILTLDFDNVFYASGVTDFSIDLRILKHAKNYIVLSYVSLITLCIIACYNCALSN